MLRNTLNSRFIARSLALTLLAGFAITSSAHVFAEDKVIDIPSPSAQQITDVDAVDGTTHPPIRITPDKSELIRLEKDAASVIVGNPLHVNVIADSSRTLVVVPRSPGATHFTVLDKKGAVIMQRHIIVASPKKNYVRVKRVCREDSDGCLNTSVFYCPDMCHEIGSVAQEEQKQQALEAMSDGEADSSSTADDLGETE